MTSCGVQNANFSARKPFLSLDIAAVRIFSTYPYLANP